MKPRIAPLHGTRFRTAILILLVLSLIGCTEGVRGIEDSMEPTIHPGEIIDFDPDAYEDRTPAIGDVVGLRAPSGFALEFCGVPRPPNAACPLPTKKLSDENLLKRVVGLPGDLIALRVDGGVIRNGQPAFEPHIVRCAPKDGCGLRNPIRIPSGHYFVMGDNRPISSDSRYWGPVPLSAIDGKAEPLR